MALPEDCLINLDGGWPDELRAYALRLADLPAASGEEETLARDLLVRYARDKADAMEARAAGNVEDAQRLERRCDRIYQRLPAWARW